MIVFFLIFLGTIKNYYFTFNKIIYSSYEILYPTDEYCINYTARFSL